MGNEIERLGLAFDELLSVYWDISEKRGWSKEAKRLDSILGKMENLMFIARRHGEE